MTTSLPLTELEQEVFDYLNDTPNARQAMIETLAARISHEFGIWYSVALEIIQKWDTKDTENININNVLKIILKEGDRVRYAPSFGKEENGIVKSTNPSGAFVVYKCNGDWDNYKNYTGCHTRFEDLIIGWNE